MERLESKQKECQLLCEIHDIVTASMHSNMEHQQQQLQERNLFGCFVTLSMQSGQEVPHPVPTMTLPQPCMPCIKTMFILKVVLRK